VTGLFYVNAVCYSFPSTIQSHRNRPCSSCVLRGMLCPFRSLIHFFSSYGPQVPQHCVIRMDESTTVNIWFEETKPGMWLFHIIFCNNLSFFSLSSLGLSRMSIDPAQEIARLRHSISLLEAHIFPNQPNNSLLQSGLATTFPKTEMADSGFLEKDTAPGMLGSPGQGGLYAGPTSAATHLLLV
jgi:hypothetical protein